VEENKVGWRAEIYQQGIYLFNSNGIIDGTE
jgi:hypothetical protein